VHESIERVLEPGEHAQWVGVPVPRYYSRDVCGALFFSLLCLAFAAGWLIKTLSGSRDVPSPGTGPFFMFMLLALVFSAIGVYLAFCPLREYRRWLRRAYVVTDRRMIAFESGKPATLRRFTVEPLGRVARFANRDGTCDLLIAPGVSTEYDAWSQRGPLGFCRIRDVDAVEALLSKLAGNYSPIETIEHPTHDRPVVIALRVSVAVAFVVIFPLAFLGWRGLAAGLFFAMVLANIVYAFIHGRRSVCPRCGKELQRDQDVPRGTYYFTCAACGVRWASRMIST
jgi:hypothetical protein